MLVDWACTAKLELELVSRFSKDVKHSDAFGRLRRVQMVQSGHRVDHPEHDGRLYPVVQQVKVSQPHWKRQISHVRLFWKMYSKHSFPRVGDTDLKPSPRCASAASCRWGWWRCTWSGRGRPPWRRLPGERRPARWCSTSLVLSWSGLICSPTESSTHARTETSGSEMLPAMALIKLLCF